MDPIYALPTLFKQVTNDIKRDLLCSCIVFPKTSSLKEDKPLQVYDWDGKEKGLDIKGFIDRVNNDPEYVAVSARNDLVLVLEVLNDVKEELLLDKMDSIQIYRGGVDLLLIKNKGKDGNGRSAFVEINDYRRRLQSTVQLKTNHQDSLNTLISLTMFVAAVTFIYKSIKK
jgi:hypothetical protein